MHLYTLSFIVCLLAASGLTACKKKPVEAPVSHSSAASTSSADTALVSPPSATTTGFDINSVPVSSVVLPPFPYLDYPDKLDDGYKHNNQDSGFDEVQLIAGRDLRTVEGKVSRRFFPHNTIGMSAIGSVKNYENAIKSLGGVLVNDIVPADPAFRKLHPEEDSVLAKKNAPAGD